MAVSSARSPVKSQRTALLEAANNAPPLQKTSFLVVGRLFDGLKHARCSVAHATLSVVLHKRSSGLLTCKVGLGSRSADLLGAAPGRAELELLVARPAQRLRHLLSAPGCCDAVARNLLLELPQLPCHEGIIYSIFPLLIKKNPNNKQPPRSKTEQTHRFPTTPTEVLYRIPFSTISLCAEETDFKPISMVAFAQSSFLHNTTIALPTFLGRFGHFPHNLLSVNANKPIGPDPAV